MEKAWEFSRKNKKKDIPSSSPQAEGIMDIESLMEIRDKRLTISTQQLEEQKIERGQEAEFQAEVTRLLKDFFEKLEMLGIEMEGFIIHAGVWDEQEDTDSYRVYRSGIKRFGVNDDRSSRLGSDNGYTTRAEFSNQLGWHYESDGLRYPNTWGDDPFQHLIYELNKILKEFA